MEVVTLEEIKEIRERDETLQSLDERFDDDDISEDMDEMMIPTEGVETAGISSFRMDNKEDKEDDASDELNDSCDEGVCDEETEQKVATTIRPSPSLRVLLTNSTHKHETIDT